MGVDLTSKEITTAQEAKDALAAGWLILCEWPRAQYNSMPGVVVRLQDDHVLVKHWVDRWMPIGGRGYKLVAYPRALDQVPPAMGQVLNRFLD